MCVCVCVCVCILSKSLTFSKSELYQLFWAEKKQKREGDSREHQGGHGGNFGAHLSKPEVAMDSSHDVRGPSVVICTHCSAVVALPQGSPMPDLVTRIAPSSCLLEIDVGEAWEICLECI